MSPNNETDVNEHCPKRMPVIRRGLALHVDECPIRSRVWNGKPYANVIDDCSYCSYNKGIEHEYDESVAVVCSG